METALSILHTFKLAVAQQLTSYRGLYSCECPDLDPKLPFRTHFMHELLQHIVQLIPPTKFNSQKPLVYVSQGPGGLFFDFVTINTLIHQGYTTITAIFIEELHQNNTAISQACLDLQIWFEQLHKAHPQQPEVRLYFFATNQDYQCACTHNPNLKGHVLCTVDPDDQATLPNFDCDLFHTRFTQFCIHTMRTQSLICSLFAHNDLRHMILGTINQTDTFLLIYDHYYGSDSLYTTNTRRIFQDQQEVLPFEPLPYGVQIGDAIASSLHLRSLFQKKITTTLDPI